MKAHIVVKELRSVQREEFPLRLARLERQYFELRVKHSTSQLDNSAQLRTLRREIARVLTVLSEKDRGIR
jgi:large subunit ribosomal protein L29